MRDLILSAAVLNSAAPSSRILEAPLHGSARPRQGGNSRNRSLQDPYVYVVLVQKRSYGPLVWAPNSESFQTQCNTL